MSESMTIVHSVAELRAALAEWREGGEPVGFVPTMGALHEGHLSLVDIALERASWCVASVFVNPAQFGPNEDFAAYPRSLEEDARLLEARGCDLLYAPSPEEMYPHGFSTEVAVGGVTDVLCGRDRPGHFAGVATVVSKLFNQVQPDIAVFGEKDFQQLQVIRRMVADLNFSVRIVGGPTAREADGLAMSSRNRRLSPAQRQVAASLNVVIREAADRIAAGARADEALVRGRKQLREAGFDSVDYLEARLEADLLPLADGADGAPARVFAAARLRHPDGDIRLIDNWPFTTLRSP